ncbi:MAG: prolyl oligopeptidase family serine peptidase [Candidatus Didemnitutus sp.]|nr:prolyl oligopeptidase family serine peptidase [Candidatus Didemnitutus sp.]
MRILVCSFLVTALAPVLTLAAVQYPTSKTIPHVDEYHGVLIADPYRWLEDLDSAATKAWVDAQNATTAAALAQMPEVAQVRQRLTELWNYTRYGMPQREAGWVFYTKNDGLQNQSPLYVQEGFAGAPRVLIDPNTLSSDGTVAVTSTSPSPDGKWLGYGLATGGSDWNEFKLRDVATGQDAADHIRWVKFSGMSWTHDSRGFFYARYAEPAGGDRKVFSKIEHRKLHYHRVGTAQAEDRLIFALPEHPQRSFGGQVSSDGRYLVIGISQPGQRGNQIAYLDLQDAQNPSFDRQVTWLVDNFNANYGFIGNVGRTFYFSTTADAPRGRVVAMNLDEGAAAVRTVIAESADTIDGVRISAGRFVVTYMRDVASRVAIFDLEGAEQGEIPLPGLGAVTSVAGKFGNPEVFVSFSSFLFPGTILRHQLDTGATTVWQEAKTDFDASNYVTKQVFYPSKDGTQIPIFITHRKDLKLDGSAPGWLYGYGGFNVVMRPQFAVPPLVWIERGGVYAVANLRGGGEYGRAWHDAGTQAKKQTVFDDFIAAAEFLVSEGYTAHSKLVIDGRSNGGLLLGAVVNQRPELFAAAVPAVGVMDMLRYHKFTAGASWARDYGTSDNKEGFDYLLAYSPLHTTKPGAKYPAVLVTTGDHDDRVHPGHSYKYTAAMQAAVAPDAGPIYIHIEANAGHGGSSGSSPVSKTIADWALRMGFGAHFAAGGK